MLHPHNKHPAIDACMADLTQGEDATEYQFCAEHFFVQPNTLFTCAIAIIIL